MQNFNTFMIAHVKDADQIDRLEIGYEWQLVTENDPTYTHWCSIEHGLPSLKITRTLPDDIRASEIDQVDETKYCLSRHVTICAPSKDTATNIRSLIHGGVLLGYPDPQNTQLRGWGVLPDNFPHSLDTEPFRQWFQQYDQMFFGCQVAAKAWEDKALIYAIEKYKFSLQLDCFTPHSEHPRHGQVFVHEYTEYESLVSASYAIIAAYSAIEELGLEARSSKQKPRFIHKKWNPVVLQDLDERLRYSNMSASTNIEWTYRGDPTAIENEMVRKEPEFGIESQWYSDRDGEVRDRQITLADAIHLVGWLRNFIAAHKFRELTQAISPYDVHNCQMVARRVILGVLNLWPGESGW